MRRNRSEMTLQRQGLMAIDIEVRDDGVDVAMTGGDRSLALKSQLGIPRGRIPAVELMKRPALRPELGPCGCEYREPTFPGPIRHGSYSTDPSREFWGVYRQEDVLVMIWIISLGRKSGLSGERAGHVTLALPRLGGLG